MIKLKRIKQEKGECKDCFYKDKFRNSCGKKNGYYIRCIAKGNYYSFIFTPERF